METTCKIDLTNLGDYDVAQLVFNHFEIKTEKKTYWELMDEVDNKLKERLKFIYKKYGDSYIEKFKEDVDASLLQFLLSHLTHIHRWSQKVN